MNHAQSALLDLTKNTQRFSVEFSEVSNLGLTQGVDGVFPEEMVELSKLIELPVIELSGANCKVHWLEDG